MDFPKSNKERAILDFFFTYPTRRIHVRELARELNLSHYWVARTLKKLESLGLVQSERQGPLLLFRALREEPFLTRKRSENIRKILGSRAIAELKAEAIVLIGSYGQGTDTERSDIDLVLVGPRGNHKAIKGLERPIHLLEVDLAKVTPEFSNTLANGFVIHGYLDLIDEDVRRTDSRKKGGAAVSRSRRHI